MRRAILIGLSLIAACGAAGDSDSSTPTTPIVSRGPAKVVVSNVVVTNSLQSATVALHAKNEGGDGAYMLEFWRYPLNVPNAAPAQIAATQATPITYPYEENLSFTLSSAAYWVVVLNRGANTAVWTRSQCIVASSIFPCPSSLSP